MISVAVKQTLYSIAISALLLTAVIGFLVDELATEAILDMALFFALIVPGIFAINCVMAYRAQKLSRPTGSDQPASNSMKSGPKITAAETVPIALEKPEAHKSAELAESVNVVNFHHRYK